MNVSGRGAEGLHETGGQAAGVDDEQAKDILIIGGGVAALTAGIYAVRFGMSVAVLEKGTFGGAVTTTSVIENFPGFVGEGAELMRRVKEQAKIAGVKLIYGECTRISGEFPEIKVKVDGEKELSAKTVIVATGSRPRTLELDTDKPIAYCAMCDGVLYAGKDVLVIGGGNTALGEGLHLAAITRSVTIVTNGEFTAQEALLKRARKRENMTLMANFTPEKEFFAQFAGIFVCIGRQPATGFLTDELLDERGFIKTDEKLMTEVAGVFAAGDVRAGNLKQAVVAAAEGAIAASNIFELLSKKA